MKKLIVKIICLFICFFIASCNAGVSLDLISDLKINQDKEITDLNGGEIKRTRVIYHGRISGMNFYGKNYKEDIKKIDDNFKKQNIESKERCVYMAWFFPINFWTYFYMTDKSLAKQAIKLANKKGYKGNNMIGVYGVSEWFGGLTIGYDCKKIAGRVVEKIN